MPKCDFTKDFDTLIEDFNAITQRAIAGLVRDQKKEEIAAKEAAAKAAKAASEKADPAKTAPPAPSAAPAPIDEEDIFSAALDRLFARTRKDFELFDEANKDLEQLRKDHAKEVKDRTEDAVNGKGTQKPPPNAEKENAELVKPFSQASDRAEKSLEAFTLKVRAQLVGRKDLGDKFSRAANELFVGLKKLDEELDKFAATELKRKPREEKKLEVIPSKFLADFKELMKKEAPDKPEDKLAKALKDVEERLKRVDTNNGFNRVTSVCEAAQSALKDACKALGKDEAKLLKGFKELIAEIEKYDNHMFLLSRMK